MLKTLTKKGIEEEQDTTINVKKRLKRLNYAPGGTPFEDEYAMSIPMITCCTYYEPLDLLFLCFIDGQCKLLKLYPHKSNEVDVEYIERIHKTGFVPQDVEIGMNRVTNEVMAIIVGENQFESVNVNPKSKVFLKVVENKHFPKCNRLSKLNEFWRNQMKSSEIT